MTDKHEGPDAPDDALVTALYLDAEETQLPSEPPYDVERGLQRFGTWLDDHTDPVGKTAESPAATGQERGTQPEEDFRPVTRASQRRWDVALSFAGEQRDYVEQVAWALQAQGVRVFYDADEQLWGKDLAKELQTIYEQTAYVVVFISADYAARDWTRRERLTALAGHVREGRQHVLSARFDDTPLPELLSDTNKVDLRTHTPQQLAAMIVDKMKLAPAAAATGVRSNAHELARDLALARDLIREVESARTFASDRRILAELASVMTFAQNRATDLALTLERDHVLESSRVRVLVRALTLARYLTGKADLARGSARPADLRSLTDILNILDHALALTHELDAGTK